MSTSLTSSSAALLENFDGFTVSVDESHERADIVLSRPPLNIISMPQREQLRAVIEELDRRDAVRVIVIRAEGKNFSSGGDIAGFMQNSPEHVSQMARTIAAPERCSKPVVVAIRGYCFGVGFELSLACDFRLVSDSAELALPEQRIGMIPGSGGSARLLQMIGIARTKDMTMRGRRITGQQAHEWGLAVDCVADGELESETDALVEELRRFSPLAQRTLKDVLNVQQDAPLHVAIDLEGQAYGRMRGSEDFAEGVASFTEKRKPRFTGK